MNILGIDPGTRNLGFSVIKLENSKISLVDAGIIKMKKEDLQFQVPQMAEGLGELFSTHSIDQVAMEDIFFAHNPQTVLKLAQMRGAIMLKILQEFGQFAEYTPLQIKQAITGNGKAQKEQVAFMVKRLLGIKKDIKPLDITDAMAVAITHSQRIRIKS